MSFKRAIILSLFVLLSCIKASAGQDYTITLKNGETLPAGSYAINGRKLMLSYPLGNAEIDLSQVSSIKSGDGGEVLFNEAGQAAPEKKAAAQVPASLAAPSLATGSIRPEVLQSGESSDPDSPPAASDPGPPAWMKQDPMADEIDAFVDRYSEAGETEPEDAEEEIDLMFSALFED